MGNMRMIPENLMALSNATIQATSEASSSMADDNLRTESPGEFWRSLSAAPGDTTLKAYIKGQVFAVDAVGLVGHNLIRGDQYRVTAGGNSQTAGYLGYNPTSTVATQNSGSTFADCDNGEVTPGATFATPTAPGTFWGITLGFPTPAFAPITGAKMQCFWVYAKVSSDTSNLSSPLTITASLYESGGLRATLQTKAVTSTTGQWLFFEWNASSLLTASGANVECDLVMTTGGASFYISIGSVVYANDHQARTNDSGWLTYEPFYGSAITFRPQVRNVSQSLLYEFPATINPSELFVHLRTCKSPDALNSQNEIPPTPDNYAQAGTLVIGETWAPTHNIGYGKLVGAIDISSRMRTYGGQLFGSRRPTRRVIAMRLASLTPAEAHALFDRVIWRGGVLKPVLISLLPDDATQSKHTTILAVLRNPENWVTIQPNEGFENSLDMEWEEVL